MAKKKTVPSKIVNALSKVLVNRHLWKRGFQFRTLDTLIRISKTTNISQASTNILKIMLHYPDFLDEYLVKFIDIWEEKGLVHIRNKYIAKVAKLALADKEDSDKADVALQKLSNKGFHIFQTRFPLYRIKVKRVEELSNIKTFF